MRIVVVSGGFDPIQEGHLDLWEAAGVLGDRLIIILNSDEFLLRKRRGTPLEGIIFWPLSLRHRIAAKWAYWVEISIDGDQTVCKTLRAIANGYSRGQLVFANGGDRKEEKDLPEATTCKELDIEMVFGVGSFTKKDSSSDMLIRAMEHYNMRRE